MNNKDDFYHSLNIQRNLSIPPNIAGQPYRASIAYNNIDNVLSYGDGFNWINLSTNSSPVLYDAIVTPGGGNGTYALLSEAISAGKTNIFITAGTYVETQQIAISGGTKITGENLGKVIIIFTGLTTPALYHALPGNLENAGTISINNNTNTVTGVGTGFTNLSIGDYIFIGGANYIIGNIINDTSLTITTVYRGTNLTGISYIALTLSFGIVIRQVTITNTSIGPSTSLGINFQGVNGVILENVRIQGFINNILLDLVSAATLDYVFSINSVGYGITLRDCLNLLILQNAIANNSGDGLVITNNVFNSMNIDIDSGFILNNGGRGIDVTSSSFINLTNTILQYNNLDGIRCNNSTSNILISQCNIQQNNIGVNHDGSYNNISSCIITGNKSSGITTGDNALVVGNVVSNNAGIGIDMGSDQDNTITGNIIHDNTSHGISISGNTQASTITGNSIYMNGGNGINISGGASGDNTISSNTIRDNTTGITLSSDNNVVVGNRVDQNTTGIIVQATADRTVVVGNNMIGNTTNFTNSGTNTQNTGNITA